MSGRLLTTRQVGERLGLSPKAVLRRWRAGELPGYRLGGTVLRFDEDDLDTYLQARRRGPPAAMMRRLVVPTTTKESADAQDPDRPDRQGA